MGEVIDANTIGTKPKYPEGQERRPIPFDFWPGHYVVLTMEDWLKIHKLVTQHVLEQARATRTIPKIQEVKVPDSGPRVCPYCGMDFWHHRSHCRMMFEDPNDPDAEY
jgi:hypothetical protein